jgi:hydroxymethylbilane synthase
MRVGARGSRLSLWQANHVIELLHAAWPDLSVELVTISTKGDRVLDTPLPLLGGKGVFTQEIEAALRDGTIDFAVHSLKDLPVEEPEGLTIGAVPERGAPGDLLISRSHSGFTDLPQGAVVGTSSPRRGAQLRHARPDLELRSIRGNVDTRIARAMAADGEYDAIVLAQSGVERLGKLDTSAEELPLDLMLPAPGQGALAIQCRPDRESLDLLTPVNHSETELATVAERAVLSGLGGGCSAPIAAYGWFNGSDLHLRGRWLSENGAERVDRELVSADCTTRERAEISGRELARQMAEAGAVVGEP